MPPQHTTIINRMVSMMETIEKSVEKPSVTALLRQPVPPLEQTMARYLESVKPFVSDEELIKTKSLIYDFVKVDGAAHKLQAFLLERQRTKENWLSEWWDDYAYLGYRSTLLLSSSTAMFFPLRDYNTQEKQLQYAAKCIASALEFKHIVDRNMIPQEKMGSQLLDMAQYHKLFGTTRNPGEKTDILRLLKKEEQKKHIIVAHNYHLYKVPVFDENNTILNEEQLIQQFKAVIEESPDVCEYPVGILTTEHRDTWYAAREELLKDEHNQWCLEEIETSLALVCLDGTMSDMEKSCESRQIAAAHKLMHGGGSAFNTPNRWFDKILQFVVGQNGDIGLTFEHTPSEGHTVAQLTDFIEARFGQEKNRPCAVNFALPNRLEFIVNEEVKSAINKAKINVDKLINNYEVGCYNFTGYGKNFIKNHNLSPDSFIQMALQLAYYRVHGQPGAQYESAMTRIYLHGRTETIRSCTPEAVNFAKLMCSDASKNEKASALREAIASHKKYVMNAVVGQGVDRHLLGLRLAAKELGMEIPEIFLDPAFERSAHMRLSTSQVVMKSNSFGFYGPLVEDGYSCCYNPANDNIRLAMSSYKSCPETNIAKFFETIDQCFRDMQFVLSAERSRRG